MAQYKNSDFTAVFNETYIVDTTSGNITATLPDPSGNEEKIIAFYHQKGSNKIILTGYDVNGVSTVKVISKGDFFQIFVIDGAYMILHAPNYFVSSTPDLWRMSLSILGGSDNNKNNMIVFLNINGNNVVCSNNKNDTELNYQLNEGSHDALADNALSDLIEKGYSGFEQVVIS